MKNTGLKKLWAPWRMAYITSLGGKDEGCIFCTKPKASEDKKNLILFRGKLSFIIMNLYPYNNGHCMVIPYKHTSDFTELTDEELLDIMQNVRMTIKVFKKVFNPDGFNTGFNIGRAAGAGISQHVHFHVVPRWIGDSNFMTVIGETRVMSEHIEATYDKLKKAFEEEQG